MEYANQNPWVTALAALAIVAVALLPLLFGCSKKSLPKQEREGSGLPLTQYTLQDLGAQQSPPGTLTAGEPRKLV